MTPNQDRVLRSQDCHSLAIELLLCNLWAEDFLNAYFSVDNRGVMYSDSLITSPKLPKNIFTVLRSGASMRRWEGLSKQPKI